MTALEKLAAMEHKAAPIESNGGATSPALPPILGAKEFRQSIITRPPEIIKGVLTQGARMVLAGPSKSRKSWVLLDLSYSVVSGKPWLSIPTTPARTLYVNFELRNHTIHDRVNRISQSRGISNDELLDLWDLRGHACDIEAMVYEILYAIEKRDPYGLIVLDPTYKLLGNRDENSAGEMTEFCSHLEWLAQDTGAAVVAAAHFPKGAMGGRISQDRIAGSGAFARDADAILTMTPHEDSTEDNPCFTIETTLREFKPIEPFVIRWDYPLMTRHAADPKKVSGKPGPKSTYEDDILLKFVPASDADTGISKSAWRKLAAEETGISKTSFYGRVGELLKCGAVVQDENTGLIKRAVAVRPSAHAALSKLKAQSIIGRQAVNGQPGEDDETEE
jgi:hypothetical protein